MKGIQVDGFAGRHETADECRHRSYGASRLSSRETAVGCHVSPRGALMPRTCSSSAILRTLVIPERLMSSTMAFRSPAR